MIADYLIILLLEIRIRFKALHIPFDLFYIGLNFKYERGRRGRVEGIQISDIGMSKIPKCVFKLTKLRSLNVSGNSLTSLDRSIGRLTQLEGLDVSKNNLTSLPESMPELKKLSSLNVAGNCLTSLPEWIGSFNNMIELDVSGNKYPSRTDSVGLTTLPESIGQLTSLQGLYVSQNSLTSLPESFHKLVGLQRMDVSGNALKSLPESIGQLSNLRSINVSGNYLTSLPKSIGQLKHLSSANLSGNRLTQLPSSFDGLESLETLHIEYNRLTSLPDVICRMKSLYFLGVQNNQLESLPETLGQLSKLVILDVTDNRLKSIPESIGNLKNLERVRLSGNQLTRLPETIGVLPRMLDLHVGYNPITSPPMEVCSRGFVAIREYFRQAEEEGVDRIFEAKLLIVGEGGAGKTTLAKKMQDPGYQLDNEEISTEGIEVVVWTFPMSDGRTFRVNIWDFGGQEIYHATHQFFLTKRSLYALVADSRKEDTDFYYWLNVVDMLSDSSPLLIVKNEKQDRHREIPEQQLRGRFSNLKETMSTNLATNRGLEDVMKNMELYISKLPLVGSELPKTWVNVRRALESDDRDYINVDEFMHICKENGFSKDEDKLQLSSYLHDLGVCLHFQDDPILMKVVILKPEWGTDAVYRALDNKDVIGNRGRFSRNELPNIWPESKYNGMHEELLRLMINFRLCYEIPDEPGSYLLPQLLSVNQPDYEWNESDNLHLRYSYEFMPKGIITRLIVAMQKFIRNQELVWKSGVILEHDDSRAEVIEFYDKRRIRLRVSGRNKRSLMTSVTWEIDKINSTFSRLECTKQIPCNCDKCIDSQKPYFYEYGSLQDFIEEGHHRIQCQSSAKMVPVMGLIDDVLQRWPSEVFISYAWGGESERAADSIETSLQQRGVEVVRDKKEIKHRGSIREFMDRLGRGRCVVVIVSKKYLESPNCMYELLQIADTGEFRDRVFPYVLEDAGIYDSVSRLQYVKYWEARISKLETAMREVSQAKISETQTELNMFTDIRNRFEEVLAVLKDMNALSPSMLRGSNYSQLLSAIEQSMTDFRTPDRYGT